jgi:pentapeptide MXKDX repeat protein
LKRIALVASALCLALGASSSFAEDKMDKMEKTDHMQKQDRMKPSGKKHGMRSDKMDKTDGMKKPGAMQ